MIYNTRIVLAYFMECGLHCPETEYVFHPGRKWRFDFAWPIQKLALEVEGGIWKGGRHNRASGFLKDMEKYNAAAILGWRVLRVVPDELCLLSTVNLIKQAIP